MLFHPGSYFRELRNKFFFCLKILKFFDAVPDPASRSRNLFDPGSGIEKFGSGIRDKHSDPQPCVEECCTALFKQKISILKSLCLVSHLCNCVPIRAHPPPSYGDFFGFVWNFVMCESTYLESIFASRMLHGANIAWHRTKLIFVIVTKILFKKD